jgi:dTDP-4-dehydrorhamnose 3,5-epimerase
MKEIPRIFKLKKALDKRGSFIKLLSSLNNKKILNKKKIQEINYSYNQKKGTIRGFHYQVGQYKEKKIIYCISGKLLDISINIKKGSKEFGKKYKFKLNQNKFLVVPEDYAHGFQTLTNNTVLLYLHTQKYNKKYEHKINPLKNNFDVKWPLKISFISKEDLFS